MREISLEIAENSSLKSEESPSECPLSSMSFRIAEFS